MNERDDRLLEDYLDDELTDEARSMLEERLRSDLPLRARLGEIAELHEALRGLPRSGIVPDRVWSAIQERIAQTPQEAASRVRSLSSAPSLQSENRASDREDGIWPFSRRFSLSIGQLAAAAVVLVAFGSGLTWAAATSGGFEPQGSVLDGGVVPVSAAMTPGEAVVAEYEGTTSQLLEILEAGESVLSEETLQVVRESLATIDEAVEEALMALDDDPGNEMLGRILRSNLQKKVDLLRQTAVAVQASA